MRERQPVGHGARLDVDFLMAAGFWPEDREILDTLDVARILMPDAASHSLPVLAAELGLDQPRPHRALDDADATRQLLLRLRGLAAGLAAGLKDWMVPRVAPYTWAIAGFCGEALTADAAFEPRPLPAPQAEPNGRPQPGSPRSLLRGVDPGSPRSLLREADRRN